MRDSLLTPDLMQAGARYVRERAPDPVTLDWLVGRCEQLERILRLQYEDGVLPEAWETELASMKPLDATGSALQAKSYLEHLYRVRWEGLNPAAPTDGSSEEAARALLRREPVVVELAGRSVEVTGRSYSAMMEIAAHDLRVKELDEVIERAAFLANRVTVALRATSVVRWGRRRSLKRRLRRVTDVHTRLYTERELHRAMIYAHALTRTGGPAASVDDAPAWWRETGPLDDAQLVGALFLAGPARLTELPDPKKPKDRADDGFGFASLFTWFEKKAGIPVARGWDTDLGQIITDVRAGNAPFDDLDEE